jgi:hypothetical protein
VRGGFHCNITSNIYDVLILFHQEYVTQEEHNNFKQFVKNGGTLILVDSNAFFAEVGYDSLTKVVTLVSGHAWQYNGKTAWKGVYDRWKEDTSNWTGGIISVLYARSLSCIIHSTTNIWKNKISLM